MIPKRVFWFVAGAAAGAAGLKRAEAELEARREQLTPANLTKVAAGKLADVAADAPGRVTNKVKDRMAQRSGNGSTARQPWQQRDWTGGGQP